jgi:N-acetylmuramoyl-L-alanine amidase
MQNEPRCITIDINQTFSISILLLSEQNRKPIDDLTTRTDAENNRDNVAGKFQHWLTSHRKYLMLLAVLAVLALLISTVILMNLKASTPAYVPGDGDALRKNIPIDSTIGIDWQYFPLKCFPPFLIHLQCILGNDLRTKGMHALRHVTRDEWLAQPANEGVSQLELPVSRVIISHTATDICVAQATCTLRTRLIQTFHIESRHWSDIGYNFLVGGDGNVYDGRGWDQEGAHTKGKLPLKCKETANFHHSFLKVTTVDPSESPSLEPSTQSSRSIGR